jgi:uncharacterized membrane protein
MTLLIIGTVLFFALHLLPSLPLRASLVANMGANQYKILFSLISALGLGLIIYGFSLSHFVPLWEPLPWGRTAAIITMPVAVILLCAAELPNNIKRYVRHPMLIGIMLWGGTHLAANGDLASTILFMSFALFAIFDVILVTVGGRYKPKAPVSALWDLAVVIIGLVVFVLIFYFHGSITGMPL